MRRDQQQQQRLPRPRRERWQRKILVGKKPNEKNANESIDAHIRHLSSPQFCVSFVSQINIFIVCKIKPINWLTNQKTLNLLFSERENQTAWLWIAWIVKKLEVSIKEIQCEWGKKRNAHRTHFRLPAKNVNWTSWTVCVGYVVFASVWKRVRSHK